MRLFGKQKTLEVVSALEIRPSQEALDLLAAGGVLYLEIVAQVQNDGKDARTIVRAMEVRGE